MPEPFQVPDHSTGRAKLTPDPLDGVCARCKTFTRLVLLTGFGPLVCRDCHNAITEERA